VILASVDPFMHMMSNGNRLRLENYSKNTTQMAADFSDLLQGLVSPIVHTSYRQPDDSPIEGVFKISSVLLRTRQISSRLVEAIFVALALIAILCSTILRPRTDLKSDPRSLGAVGILLSRSTGLEDTIRNTGEIPRETFCTHLTVSFVRTVVEDGAL
jgi:hypothetical protein